jgi:hypothetical protein
MFTQSNQPLYQESQTCLHNLTSCYTRSQILVAESASPTSLSTKLLLQGPDQRLSAFHSECNHPFLSCTMRLGIPVVVEGAHFQAMESGARQRPIKKTRLEFLRRLPSKCCFFESGEEKRAGNMRGMRRRHPITQIIRCSRS